MKIIINDYLLDFPNLTLGNFQLIDNITEVGGVILNFRYPENIIATKVLELDFKFNVYITVDEICMYLEILDYLLASPSVMELFYEAVAIRMDRDTVKAADTLRIHRLGILKYTYPKCVQIQTIKKIISGSCIYMYYIRIGGPMGQISTPVTDMKDLAACLNDYICTYIPVSKMYDIRIEYSITSRESPTMRLHCPQIMGDTEQVNLPETGSFDLTSYIVSYLENNILLD